MQRDERDRERETIGCTCGSAFISTSMHGRKRDSETERHGSFRVYVRVRHRVDQHVYERESKIKRNSETHTVRLGYTCAFISTSMCMGERERERE